MKDNKQFSFGKPDANDLKHLGIGAVIYGILFLVSWLISSKTSFDLGLTPQWVSLIGTVSIAFIWEFGQKWFYGAMIDFKDILVSSVPGLITAILIEVL